MCTKNPVGNFYCLQKAMELEKQGAFQGESPSDEFPDMCNINCSTTTAKAIKELGCCSAVMIDMMQKEGAEISDIRTAKAVAWKCGGEESLTLCDGNILPTMILPGVETVEKCPKTKQEEQTFKKNLAKKIAQSTHSVSISACTGAQKCDGRRLASGSKEVHYTVKVTASSPAQLKSKISKVRDNPNFKAAKVGKVGVAPTTTDTPKAGNEADGASSKVADLAALLAVMVVSCAF